MWHPGIPRFVQTHTFEGIDVPRARDYEMEEQLFVFLYVQLLI